MRGIIPAFLFIVLAVLAALVFPAAAGDLRHSMHSDYQVAEIRLSGAQGATGTAEFRVDGDMPLDYSVGLLAYGLKPNSVYSVWLTDGYGVEGRDPLGIRTNYFRTNGAGTGRYVTSVSYFKLRPWRSMEVFYHPDGDPANTREITSALKGTIRFY